MNETIGQITETVMSPQAGVPLGAAPGGMLLFGIPLPEWLIIFSLLYTITLLGYTGWKWYRDWREERKKENE